MAWYRGKPILKAKVTHLIEKSFYVPSSILHELIHVLRVKIIGHSYSLGLCFGIHNNKWYATIYAMP